MSREPRVPPFIAEPYTDLYLRVLEALVAGVGETSAASIAGELLLTLPTAETEREHTVLAFRVQELMRMIGPSFGVSSAYVHHAVAHPNQVIAGRFGPN